MTIKQKKQIVVIVSAVIMLIGMLVGGLFVANSVTGFLNDIETMFADTGILGMLGFAVVFIAIDTCFFFISGLSAAFIYLANILFPVWLAFIICSVSIFTVSMLIYLLGRKIGTKAFLWAFSEADYEKANHVISSPTFIFLALLFPGFPDTLICFLAGTGKLKAGWFALIVTIARTIGVASICFLDSGILAKETWQQCIAVIGLIPTLAIMFSAAVSFITVVIGAFIGGKWLEKKAAAKHAKDNICH